MCGPLPTAVSQQYFSTASDDNTSCCCCYGGRHDDDDDRPRRLSVRNRQEQQLTTAYTAVTQRSSQAAPDSGSQQDARHRRSRHRRHPSCRFAPYPSTSSKSPVDKAPMFKQGFPSGVGRMADADQTASSVPLPPPPPAATLPSAFNLQFNHQTPMGFSSFASENHNYYNHQFPYTFLSASPPTYSWANTNSTDIMKFTGSSNPRPLDTSTYHISNFGSVPKRKIDLEAELPQPPKMRITEEKVSASLRDMHISNTFKPHDYCANTNVSDMDPDMIIEDPNPSSVISTNDISKTESKTTLVMCEELRKLNKIDSIIPQPLLNVGRPTNAVVVWKPKPVVELVRSFSNYPEEPESTVVITEITDDEEKELNNDNEMFVEDDNTIAVEDDDMEL